MNLESILPNVKNSPLCSPIKNKQFITYLTKNINFNYGVKGSELTFPAPQPVSIEKKDFSKLEQYLYSVSLKLDGVRFLMYFIRDKKENQQCIIINRALNFYNISIEAEDNLYNGTILDGEVIFNEETKKWEFIIHDALMLCGNKINKLTHSVRLGDTTMCIQSLINNNSDTNTFTLIVKKFYPFSEINDFIDNVYSKSTNNDGLIFMPEMLPVISGTQYSMLKWKPENKHTFDFLIKENEKNLEAFVFHMGNISPFAKIHENTEDGKEFILKTKELNEYKDGCIVECNFNKDKNNFVPILIRTDKTHPNSLRTVERTLFNITENIQLQDFKDIKQNVSVS